MTYEEAVERAVKFLKLSKSDNANEAALAAAKAQEIIERFKLDIGTLEAPVPERPREDVKNHAEAALHESKKLATWRQRLASYIADVNACRIYFRGGSIYLIGRTSDAQTVRYLFALLERATDELAEQHSGQGRTWLNNFRLGVVDTIGSRLREKIRETRETAKAEAAAQGEAALMRLNKAIARLDEDAVQTAQWEKEHMKYSGHRAAASWRGNAEARAAGREAGKSVAISSARGGLNA